MEIGSGFFHLENEMFSAFFQPFTLFPNDSVINEATLDSPILPVVGLGNSVLFP